MSTPPLQPSGAAAMTQLPPSPEGKSAAAVSSVFHPVILGGGSNYNYNNSNSNNSNNNNANTAQHTRRLRSMARYQAFHPQALACSNTLTSSSLSDEESSTAAANGNTNGNVNPNKPTSSSTKTTTTNNNPAAAAPRGDTGPSSLGAVAGPQGVALFRLSRPHVPLLILSHATNSTAGLFSSLAFQPTPITGTSSNSIYLAAARGSGVLVWDASGHSTSPLMGRLGVDATMSSTSSFDLDARITSIAWKPSTVAPLLAATNATTLSLWDLRSTPQGSVNSNSNTSTNNTPSSTSTSTTTTTQFKPTLRFGSAPRKGPAGSRSVASSFVQVACSADSDEFATIDSIGTVRIYDIRMTERASSSKSTNHSRSHTSGSAVAMFSAFDTAGVGISYFGGGGGINANANSTSSTSSSSSWLTWGLDNLQSPVVKIWSANTASTTNVNTSATSTNNNASASANNNADDDDYWFMDSVSPGAGLSAGGAGSGPGPSQQRPPRQTDYQLVAQCSGPNLACARVCASPIEGSFMAIGHTGAEGGGWWADLYKLALPDNGDDAAAAAAAGRNSMSRTFGLEKVVGFTGGSPSADNKALSSVLGTGADLGDLQAAELAFSSIRSREDVVTSSGENEEDTGDMELLLCCLSDTGIVTTHVVPEAIPRSTAIKSTDMSTRRSEMSPTRPSRTMLRTGFSANQAKVYPEDREGTSLFDAAGFWGTDTQNNRSDDPFSDQTMASPPQKKSGGGDPLMSHSRRPTECGVMPFDLEVPIAYGSVTAGNITGLQIGVNDITSGKVGATTGMGVVGEGDNVAGDVRDTNAMMENIETERVPCPRLCGATFGSGNGGLAIFHNGEVKKMWYWYQRADTVRISGAPGVQGDAAFSDAESIELVLGSSGRTSHPPSPKAGNQKLAISSSGPRTLKELMSMTTSAKEAQWGERNGSDGSDSEDSLSAADNFFEDDSLDDSNSSDSGDTPSTPPSDMYSRYLGQNWKGKQGRLDTQASPSCGPNSESPASSRKTRACVGPSSDMLAPLVSVTHAFDSMVLNHQSIYLAKEWELGGWDYNPSQALVDYQPSGHRRIGSLEEGKEGPTGEDLQAPSSPSRRNAGLPSNRFVVTPTRRNQMLPRPRSDPNLINTNRPRNAKYNIEEEQGVHGGEYAVRPNMEESMTFLRKLFTHQQEGGTSFPALRSPPDSPLLANSLVKGTNNFSKVTKRAFSTDQISTFPGAQPKLASNDLPGTRKSESNDIRVMPLGVYTLSLAITDENKSDTEELKEIKRICLHNASVCEAFGSTEKAGVWNLLAETVDSQVKDNGKAFNGWGGNGGGALGVDLVSNLLRYYESLGDVQMLATMFCVLSGGHGSTRRPGGRPYLLPQGQEEKYDAYIRRYAELLYGWGLLSLRAELNKHLLRIPPRPEKDPSNGEKTETGRSPGLALVFVCPRCDREADPDTNICRTCQDFAFRCSICDSAVRGLFTVCDTCNHGGHVEHIKSWFAKNDECPTGCGCSCTFTSYMPQTDIV